MALSLRRVRPGRELIEPRRYVPRHRHFDAYALIALSGSFEQVSYAGRVTARPGCLIVQPTLDCHANRTGGTGAEILRLSWPRVTDLGAAFALDDLDAVVRLAETDPAEATRCAMRQIASSESVPSRTDSWCDLLAADLAADSVPSLREWAERRGFGTDTLARRFARAYGISPSRMRSELKARRAWLAVTGSNAPLASVAAECGFADQSHMTRAVRALTGAPAGVWRTIVSS